MQLLTSMLRTLVPALWGAVVFWLIGRIPALAPLQDQILGLADIAVPVITAVIIGAWYAFWRWLEPRLPDWLTRAVLGSAKTPVYLGKHTATTPATVDEFPSEAPASGSPAATKTVFVASPIGDGPVAISVDDGPHRWVTARGGFARVNIAASNDGQTVRKVTVFDQSGEGFSHPFTV